MATFRFGQFVLCAPWHYYGLSAPRCPAVIGALFFGGPVQLMAGMKEFRTGNNLGFAAFST
jgi:succinate-acetate transporter protein